MTKWIIKCVLTSKNVFSRYARLKRSIILCPYFSQVTRLINVFLSPTNDRQQSIDERENKRNKIGIVFFKTTALWQSPHGEKTSMLLNRKLLYVRFSSFFFPLLIWRRTAGRGQRWNGAPEHESHKWIFQRFSILYCPIFLSMITIIRTCVVRGIGPEWLYYTASHGPVWADGAVPQYTIHKNVSRWGTIHGAACFHGWVSAQQSVGPTAARFN